MYIFTTCYTYQQYVKRVISVPVLVWRQIVVAFVRDHTSIFFFWILMLYSCAYNNTNIYCSIMRLRRLWIKKGLNDYHSYYAHIYQSNVHQHWIVNLFNFLITMMYMFILLLLQNLNTFETQTANKHCSKNNSHRNKNFSITKKNEI